MEKPQNSIDLFEFSRNFGAVKEQPAKIIFRQVTKLCMRWTIGGCDAVIKYESYYMTSKLTKLLRL